jgi:Tfp pilus assembly protein PilO
MQLVLQGSYHNLGRFFDRISTMTRLMSVSDLAIKAVPKAMGDGGTITATCIATTFVFKKDMSADDSKTAAAPAAAPATGGKK